MHLLKKILFPIISIVFFLSGCSVSATRDSYITMDLPLIKNFSESKTEANKTLFIDEILDNRIFTIFPEKQSIDNIKVDKSIPIYDPSKFEKSKVIGGIRSKSNPRLLGEIVLNNDQSTGYMIKESLKRVAKQKGYRVITDKEEVKKDTVIVKACINKFWVWDSPDVVGVAPLYSGLIESEFTIFANKKQISKFDVKGESIRHGTPKIRSYLNVINEAYSKFYDDLYIKLQ